MNKRLPIPADGPEIVEIAPGFFIPAKRYEEFMDIIERDPEVNEAINEIIMERTSTDPLTEEMCTYVPFDFQADLEWKLAQLMMESENPILHERAQIFIERSNANFAIAQSLYAVHSFRLAAQ